MPIYIQICLSVSEEKIFKELIRIIVEKQPRPHGSLIYWQRKFILAILVEGH